MAWKLPGSPFRAPFVQSNTRIGLLGMGLQKLTKGYSSIEKCCREMTKHTVRLGTMVSFFLTFLELPPPLLMKILACLHFKYKSFASLGGKFKLKRLAVRERLVGKN